MLTKTVVPKTKAELIRALQAASFRSFELYEGDTLAGLPSRDILINGKPTILVLR